MGYTTDFEGKFTINKPVDTKTAKLMRGIAATRRMKRAGLPEEYGIDGEFYIKDDEVKVVDCNEPPSTQPGLWCQWELQEDNQTIQWDGNEKFYDYVEWLEYIIKKILAPKGYILNGKVYWSGEEVRDHGTITVQDNKITVRDSRKRAKTKTGDYIILSVQGCFPNINLETNEEGASIVFSSRTEAEEYAKENCAWEYRIVKW